MEEEEEDERRRADEEARTSVIRVRLQKKDVEEDEASPQTRLHYLPFLIDREGPAPSIRRYFVVEKEGGDPNVVETTTATGSEAGAATSTDPAVTTQQQRGGAHGDDVLRTSFRGRLLRGKSLALPPDYQGVVLQEGLGRNADGEMEWHVNGKFTEWTYWNHDTQPRPSDLPQQWMEWLEVSRWIHEHVE